MNLRNLILALAVLVLAFSVIDVYRGQTSLGRRRFAKPNYYDGEKTPGRFWGIIAVKVTVAAVIIWRYFASA